MAKRKTQKKEITKKNIEFFLKSGEEAALEKAFSEMSEEKLKENIPYALKKGISAPRASKFLKGLIQKHSLASLGNTQEWVECCLKHDNAEVLKAMIDKGINLRWQNERGQTPYSIAAAEGASKCLDVLLADQREAIWGINTPDKRDFFPLDHALLFQQSPAVVEKLVKAGARIDTRDEAGFTWFFRAFKDNKCPIEPLLKHPQIRDVINAEAKDGLTPLMWAVVEKNVEAIRLLIDQGGADPTYVNSKGESAISRAIECPQPGILEALMANRNFSAIDHLNLRGLIYYSRELASLLLAHSRFRIMVVLHLLWLFEFRILLSYCFSINLNRLSLFGKSKPVQPWEILKGAHMAYDNKELPPLTSRALELRAS